MLHYRAALCAFVITGLLAAPARADVIGSQAGSKKAPATAPLTGKLREMGMTEADAATSVARLTPDEVAYFSVAPERIQVVGDVDNMWYETALGAAFGVGMTALIIGIVAHNKDHN